MAQASIFGLMLCMQYGSNLCIMYQYKARCAAAMTQAVHRPSKWFNTAQLITLNIPHHTLSISFFSTLVVVNT